VEGDGFTDHCPRCLWGRHVDVHPGDRQAECGSLMEPVDAEKKRGQWRILYRCQECDHKHWNRLGPDDDFSLVIKLTTKPERGIFGKNEKSKAFQKAEK